MDIDNITKAKMLFKELDNVNAEIEKNNSMTEDSESDMFELKISDGDRKYKSIKICKEAVEEALLHHDHYLAKWKRRIISEIEKL